MTDGKNGLTAIGWMVLTGGFLVAHPEATAQTPLALPDPRSPITVVDAAPNRGDVPIPHPPATIQLTNAKQLFVDDWIVESFDGLTRTFHSAVKHPGNPLLKPERPWEQPAVLLSGTVMYDPTRREDRFRIWYLCYSPQHQADFRGVRKKEGRIAFAFSADGLQWQRPLLGLHEYRGSRDNNIVIPEAHGFPGVLLDPRDADPKRLYKAHARTARGHTAYFSADGLHWSEPQVMRLDGYDRSSVHWDPVRETWFASTKSWFRTEPGAVPWRGCGYQTSQDYLNFTLPARFLAGTAPQSDELVYALEPFYYETLYLGIWARYRHEPDGLLDPQLCSSRNGLHWDRPTSAALIPLTPLPPGLTRKKTPGSPETGVDPFDSRVPWDYGNTNVNVLGPLRVRDELWIYYSGRTSDHRSQPQTGAIGLATLRLDGFASLDAGENGVLTTRPLNLTTEPLRLNADAAGGEIRVEVLDEQGRPIAPYTLANCNVMTANNLRHTVTWNQNTDLSPLRDRRIRLRIVMRRAKLFALWVGDERPWDTPDTTTWQQP